MRDNGPPFAIVELEIESERISKQINAPSLSIWLTLASRRTKGLLDLHVRVTTAYWITTAAVVM